MSEFHIAVVAGDGIGPEVTEQAITALNRVGEIFHHTFHFNKVLAGGCAIDEVGKCLPDETLEQCKKSRFCIIRCSRRPKMGYCSR